MKRIPLLIAAGVAFVLGSRAGRAPYEALAAKARTLAGKPEVRDAVEHARDVAAEKVTDAGDAVADKVRDVLPGEN